MIVAIKNKTNLNQLVEELKYSLKDLSSNELSQIFLISAKDSFKVTINNKVQSINSLYQLSKKTIARYKEDGIKNSLVNDLNKTKDFLTGLPSSIKNIYDHFLKLPYDKKIEAIISAVIISSIYFTAAGGIDAEGGIPDMDITVLGIEHHRSVFTHSILIGLGMEFSGRLTISVLEKVRNRLPAEHLKIWDRVYNFIDNNKEKAVAAMWIGIGVHLIKDSGIIMGGFKSYADLPFSMSEEMHRATFAINGAAATSFAKH